MQQLYYKIRSYYKMRRFYYKMRRLLQIATVQYFKPTLWQRTSPKFRSSYNNCWQGASIFSKNSEETRNISGNMTHQGFFCYLSLAITKTSSFVVGSVFSSVNSCESYCLQSETCWDTFHPGKSSDTAIEQFHDLLQAGVRYFTHLYFAKLPSYIHD